MNNIPNPDWFACRKCGPNPDATTIQEESIPVYGGGTLPEMQTERDPDGMTLITRDGGTVREDPVQPYSRYRASSAMEALMLASALQEAQAEIDTLTAKLDRATRELHSTTSRLRIFRTPAGGAVSFYDVQRAEIPCEEMTAAGFQFELVQNRWVRCGSNAATPPISFRETILTVQKEMPLTTVSRLAASDAGISNADMIEAGYQYALTSNNWYRPAMRLVPMNDRLSSGWHHLASQRDPVTAGLALPDPPQPPPHPVLRAITAEQQRTRGSMWPAAFPNPA